MRRAIRLLPLAALAGCITHNAAPPAAAGESRRAVRDECFDDRDELRRVAAATGADPATFSPLVAIETRCRERAIALLYEAGESSTPAERRVALAERALALSDRPSPERDRALEILARRPPSASRAQGLTHERAFDPPPDVRDEPVERPASDLSNAELMERAGHFEQIQNWLAARQALRIAVEREPKNDAAVARLEAVQSECIRNAKRQISEAKAYEAAYNYPEALKSLDLAMKFADRETDKENQQAREIVKRIRRSAETTR